MAAFLIVVDAPAYVPTDPDGSFSFKSLAPGKWRVQAWNERSGAPLETEVEITAGRGQVETTSTSSRYSQSAPTSSTTPAASSGYSLVRTFL